SVERGGWGRRGALRTDAAAQAVLRAARDRLASLPEWEDSAIDAAVREAGAGVGARGRALFEPLRIALTGEEHGPPLSKVAAVLGRAAVLDLLDAAIGPGAAA